MVRRLRECSQCREGVGGAASEPGRRQGVGGGGQGGCAAAAAVQRPLPAALEAEERSRRAGAKEVEELA